MKHALAQSIARLTHGFLGLMLIFAAGSAHAEWVEWVGDVGVSAEYRHNLNFAVFSENAEDDVVAEVKGSVGRFYQAAEHTRIGLRLQASANVHEKYKDLNGVIAGIGVIGIHKFGLGNAPVLRAHLTQEAMEIRDTMRDSTRLESGLQLSKRLTDRFDGNIGVTRSVRRGHDGDTAITGLGTDVFDQTQTIWSLRGSYLLTERALLSGQFSRLNGEFDAQCPESGIGLIAKKNSAIKAAANDTVFGGRCTYRLDGNVNIYSMDFSYFLTPTASLDVGYVFRDGSAGSLDYNSPSIRMGLNWIF